MSVKTADVSRATQQILDAARRAASGPDQSVQLDDLPAEVRPAVQEAAGGAATITLDALAHKMDELKDAAATLHMAPSPLAAPAQVAGSTSPAMAAQQLAAGGGVAELLSQVVALASHGVEEAGGAEPVNLRQGVGVAAFDAAQSIAQGLPVSAHDVAAQVAALSDTSAPEPSSSSTAVSAAQQIAQGGAVSPLAVAAAIAGS